MDTTLYKEFLMEEEKFLKVLERNLKDQINRLKVEELSILKLISNSDPSQYGNAALTDHDLLPDDTPLFPPGRTNPVEVSLALGHGGGRQVEGQGTTPFLSLPPTRMEMSSEELAGRTSDNYEGFSSHSNDSSPQESASDNRPVNRPDETSTALKRTGELNSSCSELNNSRTPKGPADIMTPVHSHVSSGSIVSNLGETMKTNPIENIVGKNSRDRVAGHSGDTNHLDLSVNVIPLNLDLVKHTYTHATPDVEIQEFVEEVDEVDDDDEDYVDVE